MPKLSRILVPVEFSPRCRGAVQYAEALSSHFHCEIVLLHVVIPPLANFSSFEAMAYTSAGDLAREIAENRTADLEAFPCTTPDDTAVRRMVLEGDPTESIVEFASGENSDLIVMPTHGYGPFRRFLLGVGIVPVDTVKQVARAQTNKAKIRATLPREKLVLAQTPQVFRYDLLVRAFAA